MTKNCSRPIETSKSKIATGPIARRVFLEKTAGLLVAAGIAAGGLQSARAAQKADKADLNYQDSPNDGRRCADCRFYDGNGGCSIVEGDISEDGWCTAWSKA